MKLRELLLVFALGLLAAIAWTWPLAAGLGERLPYDARFTPYEGSDSHQYVWNLWWLRDALSRAHDPLQCDRIFWPAGHSLALHTHALSWAALSLPLQWAGGLPFALNATLLVLFAASATAAWALGRALGLARGVCAWLALAYAFCAYFQQKGLEHLSYAATPWPPLLALCAWRIRQARQPRGWAIAGGAVLALALWTDAVGGAFVALLGVLLVLIAPGAERSAARADAPAAPRLRDWLPWALAAAALLSAPYAIAIARELAHIAAQPAGPLGLGREQLYHPRLVDFARPSGLHPLWAGDGAGAALAGASFAGKRPESSALYLGWTCLALAALGCWRGGVARRWGLCALVLLVLCWDPGPDPEGWLSGVYRRIPGFDVLRVPARAFPVAMLCSCVSAAFGLQQLARRRAWIALCLGATAFETWCGPYTLGAWSVPQAVREIALDPSAGAVCVLPFHPGSYQAMSWQSVHHKPVTSSYVARTDPQAIERLRRTAPDLFAFALGEQLPDPLSLAIDLQRLDIAHVLVPAAELQDPKLLTGVLDDLPGWERVATEDGVLWWRKLAR